MLSLLFLSFVFTCPVTGWQQKPGVSSALGAEPATTPTGVCSVVSIYNILKSQEQTKHAIHDLMGSTAKDPGCFYSGWTQLGPKLLVRDAFRSGAAAQHHFGLVGPLVSRLRRDGDVVLEHMAVHGSRADVNLCKESVMLMAEEGSASLAFNYAERSCALFQSPEEIHGPPSPFSEIAVIELIEEKAMREINEGFFLRATESEEGFAKSTEITSYFKVLNWEATRSRLAELIGLATCEEKCTYQGWTRSRDLLIMRETFASGRDAVAHWSRTRPLLEAMFLNRAAYLNRVEVHSECVAAAEEAAQLRKVLEFATFDRVETETVGVVFARRAGNSAHKRERDIDDQHSLDDTHPFSRTAATMLPRPSPSWATKRHRVDIGRVPPSDNTRAS